MDRKEYPALLGSLQPAQAVTVFNDRMRHVSLLNAQIADWLQERRRVEELYVQGLRKLANKHPPDDSSDLGIFSIPWQKIVSATESLAESHHQLAQKIEADVERPLRDFTATNRDVQNISNMAGNLGAMAKDIDASKKKADKLRDKGAKAQASKVANAVSDVEQKTSEWESQAPYIFEQLQAVDESRLNHLRDALTQFQTHEVDQLEKHRVFAEETLNVLLNVETADEIKTWALRMQGNEKPRPSRKASSNTPGTPSRGYLAPPPSSPPQQQQQQIDDQASQKSGSVHELPHKHGGLQGLKRLGTVLGRRRQSVHPYGRALSPERKSSSNLSSAFSFGKGKQKAGEHLPPPTSSSSDRPGSPLRQLSSTPRPSDAAVEISPKQARNSSEKPNGAPSQPTPAPAAAASPLNGIHEELLPRPEAAQSDPALSEAKPKPEKDAEGFSVPPSASDPISEAQREADVTAETPVPQFKLDIRNAPIQEEEGDVDAALANMANTLRAQAAPTKRSGTLRGRRDVRNTIFVPNPATPDFTAIADSSIPPLPLSASPSSVSNSTVFPTPAPPAVPASPPFKIPHRPFLDDHAASDTQSIRSGHSLSSHVSTTIKHPDLHGPGLNTSLVETVSAWFEHGTLTKAMVIGQVALAYNPVDLSAPFGTETIRLENFPVLEKVAPNPAFVEQVSDQPGNYSVDLSKITHTTVGFHYQVHLDSNNLASYAPIVLSPVWKSEPTQTSALLNYSLNPAFDLGEASSVTLSNLILVLRLEPGIRPKSCQSKPVGTFSREKGLIYWRLGDVTLSRDQPAQPIRARFFTDAEARPGNCEARWEINGEQTVPLGSGLGVSLMRSTPPEKRKEDETDPFADADAEAEDEKTEEEKAEEKGQQDPVIEWKTVSMVKKITSGTYLGV